MQIKGGQEQNDGQKDNASQDNGSEEQTDSQAPTTPPASPLSMGVRGLEDEEEDYPGQSWAKAFQIEFEFMPKVDGKFDTTGRIVEWMATLNVRAGDLLGLI